MKLDTDDYDEIEEFVREWEEQRKRDIKEEKAKKAKEIKDAKKQKKENKLSEEKEASKLEERVKSNVETDIVSYMSDATENIDEWREVKTVNKKKTYDNAGIEKEWRAFKLRLLIFFLSGLIATGYFTMREVKTFIQTAEEIRVQREEKKEEPNLRLAEAYFNQWKDQEYLARISGISPIEETDGEEVKQQKMQKMQETYDSLPDEFKFYIRNPEVVAKLNKETLDEKNGSSWNNAKEDTDSERD